MFTSIPHAGKSGIIESCLKHHPLWNLVKPLKLCQNIRILPSEEKFGTFWILLGNRANTLSYKVTLPNRVLCERSTMDFTYSDLNQLTSEEMTGKVVLALKNEDCASTNLEVPSLPHTLEQIYFTKIQLN